MKQNYQWAVDNDLKILHDEDLYNEMLDDCYGQVSIGGLPYFTSQALKSVDPTAYRCGLNDYIDGLLQDKVIVALDDETLVDAEEYKRLMRTL